MFISGQEVSETEGGNLKISIKSPYKAAGEIYGFPDKGWGCGINEGIVWEAIIKECLIIVDYNDNIYWIKPSEICEIVQKHKSKEMQGSVNLFIVPLKALHVL